MHGTLTLSSRAHIDFEDDPVVQARLIKRALGTSFQGRVTYRQGEYIEGVALARNLGYGDIALKLNRFIAPGATIDLDLDCLTFRGLPIQLRAEVESCEQAENDTSFVAFVHVRRNASREPDAGKP